jgi:phosphoserine phosphatase RsbU/P
MRVLIADDDIVTARRLQGLLTSWGYEVITVRDGPSAIDVLTGPDAPALALLDWMMPGADGPEVCRRIRAKESGQPIYAVLLTARAGQGDIVAGLDAGADDYLAKPFDADELRARLKVGARIVDLQRKLASNVEELTEALGKVRQLTGLLPICAYCKSIRDDSNYWHAVEEFVSDHADVRFSHGICPNCLEIEMAAADRDVEDKP